MTANQHGYTIEGRRIWMALPYGSPVKGRIKAAGAHWDRASQRWWIGTVARSVVIPIMEEAMGKVDTARTTTVDVDLDAAAVAGVTETEGRPASKYAASFSSRRTLSVQGVPLATWYGDAYCDKQPGGMTVKLSEFAMLIVGEIAGGNYGSRRRPDFDFGWDDGTVVRVEVAEPVAERWIAAGFARSSSSAESPTGGAA